MTCSSARLQRSSHRVTLEWFTRLAADDMVKRVAALPAHSAIFYPTIRVDGHGVPQEGDALLLRFIEEDRAPIFTHTDSLFGHGIVGGPMFSSQEMADACAKVAVRLLNGEPPGDIKIVPVGLAAPRYDWRQLQKWGIKDKPASAWQRNPVSGANGVATVFLANRIFRCGYSDTGRTYRDPVE